MMCTLLSVTIETRWFKWKLRIGFESQYWLDMFWFCWHCAVRWGLIFCFVLLHSGTFGFGWMLVVGWWERQSREKWSSKFVYKSIHQVLKANNEQTKKQLRKFYHDPKAFKYLSSKDTRGKTKSSIKSNNNSINRALDLPNYELSSCRKTK